MRLLRCDRHDKLTQNSQLSRQRSQDSSQSSLIVVTKLMKNTRGPMVLTVLFGNTLFTMHNTMLRVTLATSLQIMQFGLCFKAQKRWKTS